ncbi:MAG: hypothetical protein QXP70_00775 [Methanomassiliicoccales archaeon]
MGGVWRFSVIAVSALLILPVFFVYGAVDAPSTHTPVVFYLHDDGRGFGHPDKRYDWANTSRPYNPTSPYFISDSYQGVELNATAPMNSFSWIAYPAVGGNVSISGNVTVILFLSASNTSIPVDLQVELQNRSSLFTPGQVIASVTTGSILISPNEKLQLNMSVGGQYVLSEGSFLELNVTRIDSNAAVSVYIEFDFNSAPSSFTLEMNSRVNSIQATPSYSATSPVVQIHVTASDTLGSSDMYAAQLSVIGTNGTIIVSGNMTEVSSNEYGAAYVLTANLTYGSYMLNISILTQPELSGAVEYFNSTSLMVVPPYLSNFSVTSPSSAQAGEPFTVRAEAYSSAGTPLIDFTGNGTLHILLNGTQMEETELHFINGSASLSLSLNITGNYTEFVTLFNATGSSHILIQPGAVESIRILPANATLRAGQTIHFSAEGFDEYGNLNRTWQPVWSAEGGNITTDGYYTAVKAGTWEVNATNPSNGISDSAQVYVTPGEIYALHIYPSISTVVAGGVYTFGVFGTDASGNRISVSSPSWSTDAGVLVSEGNESVLTVSKNAPAAVWLEVSSQGLSSILRMNITPSTLGPILLSRLPLLQWPAGSENSLNLSNFFALPPGDILGWNVSYSTLAYPYGEGILGNTELTLIARPYTAGYSNLTLTVFDANGYSFSTQLSLHILPVPQWNSSLPFYITVPAGVQYALQYMYFLSLQANVETSSAFVSAHGPLLIYDFPLSDAGEHFAVALTASTQWNTSGTVVQIVTVADMSPPLLNTARAPPSSISLDIGATYTLSSPLSDYFISPYPLTFQIACKNVTASISHGRLVVTAPSRYLSAAGTVLVSASYDGGYAFLLINVHIVDVVEPPYVKTLPTVHVHYSDVNYNYAFPLAPYVTVNSTVLSAVTLITGSEYISFSSNNFSLLFSMPANSTGGSNYTGAYEFTTNLTFLDGQPQNVETAVTTVPLTVVVSNEWPPVLRTPLVPTIEIPEYGNATLNLTSLVDLPGGGGISFGVISSAFNISIVNGAARISPTPGFVGTSEITFTANTSSGFLDFTVPVLVYSVYITPVFRFPTLIDVGASPEIINLSAYIQNPGGIPLRIVVQGQGVQVLGTTLIVSLPQGVSAEKVELLVYGTGLTPVSFNLELKHTSSPIGVFELFSFILAAALIGILTGIIVRQRSAHRFAVNGAFLMHVDGRLIGSWMRPGGIQVDADQFVGILSAVNSFIAASTRDDSALNRIDLGGRTFWVCRGTNLIAILEYTGNPPPRWFRKASETVSGIERSFPFLAIWDGRREALRGIEDFVQAFFD